MRLRLTLLCLPVLAVAVPAQGALIASWSLDELSGNISDATGNNPAGTPTGAPDYGQPGVPNGTYGSITVANARGTSIGFGPSTEDDFFVLGDSNVNAVLGLDRTGTFTVMSWINPLAPDMARTYRPISTGGAAGGAGGWGLGLRLNNVDGTGSAIRFTSYAVADNDSDLFDVAFGEWIHIAVTYNNGAIDYYLNGNLLGGSDNSLFNDDTGDARLTIGSRLGGNDADQKNGLLDGIRVYDTVLTAAEIRAAAAASVVPEPAATALCALGLSTLFRRRR